MIYFFIIVYMFLLPVTVIYCLIKILDIVEDLRRQIDYTEQKAETNIQKRRTHKRIAISDYGNVFSKRNTTYDYSEYKNQNGLYEPVKPHKGIKLSNKKDEREE